MDINAKLKKLFERTESELQALISEAAQAKDYDMAAQIATIAKSLEKFRISPSSDVPMQQSRSRSAQSTSLPSKPRVNTQDGEYPRFSVMGNDLVKTGWSKKARKEYSQKAPRLVLDTLTQRLSQYTDEELFTIEDILPDMVDENGEALPSYQVYIALAFLRTHALVKQHGRQGYSLIESDCFHTRVSSMWRALEQFR